MSWNNHPEGSTVEWAVEHTYGDGERRYYSYGEHDDSEADARKDCEIADLERMRTFDLIPSETTVVATRVVSRQISRTAWGPS